MVCLGNLIRISTALICMQLIACTSTEYYAPVLNGVHHLTPKGEYRVQRNDTLYSIAWDFGQDYRELAARNQIKPPYALQVGQTIRIKGPIIYKPVQKSAIAAWKPQSKIVKQIKNAAPIEKSIVAQPVKQWLWPTKGKLIQNYAPMQGKKGIDIAGTLGSPIKTTAGGQVVYAGSGLAGYGNLIIIKHNDEYLSAYAHNQKLLVHEGESVKAGQVIATMGNTGSEKVKLHFEIRKAGKPVNPLSYLKK